MKEQESISRPCTRFPLKEGYKICYPALQKIFALKNTVERMPIFRIIQMLGHFWPQITLRKKNKQNKLKGKLILFLLKIFLSLLYKFLLSGFYVMVIFKITSGTTCYISSKPPGSYYSTMDLKLM